MRREQERLGAYSAKSCVHNAEGGSPAAIFREAGLDPKIIGYKRVERCIARWKAENAEKAAETAVENSENQGE